MALNVLVTGAGGRTGRLVLESLVAAGDAYDATGLVRSKARAKESMEETYARVEARLSEGDITKEETLREPLKGKDALVILTSAVPKMNPPVEGQAPSFYYEEGGMPETVDWHGAKRQIDLAIEAGVKHVVLVGSMGSTDDANQLNRIGNGNILRFKRKAELYLIGSGVDYTIINPAGLCNEEPGKRELVVGHNDELFTVYGRGTIPRKDVARVVTSALSTEKARNKAFDILALPIGDGTPTADVVALFDSTGPDL